MASSCQHSRNMQWYISTSEFNGMQGSELLIFLLGHHDILPKPTLALMHSFTQVQSKKLIALDVLQPRKPLFRLLRRRLYHQSLDPTRKRLRHPLRTKVYGRKRADWSKIPRTTSTDDEPTSSGPLNAEKWTASVRYGCIGICFGTG